MAGAICGPKVSSAQCFRGIAAETWRVAAHGQWAGGGRKLAAGALSGRIWRSCKKGRGRRAGGGQSWGAAGGRAAEPGRKLAESAELLLASPNWGRFIAMSAYRGGMSEAGFTGMLDPAAVPMIFAAWAAPAGRSKLLAGRGAVWAQRPELLLGESPGGPGRAGFSPSAAREFAKRRAEQDGKTQRGWGFGGWGHTFGAFGRAAAGGRRGGGGAGGGGAELAELAELLSKNCSKGWFGWKRCVFPKGWESCC